MMVQRMVLEGLDGRAKGVEAPAGDQFPFVLLPVATGPLIEVKMFRFKGVDQNGMARYKEVERGNGGGVT